MKAKRFYDSADIIQSISRDNYTIDVVQTPAKTHLYTHLIIGNQGFMINRTLIDSSEAIEDTTWRPCLLDHALANLSNRQQTVDHCERCRHHGKYSK